MTLKFLGTRGEIDARTRRHRMHTSLLVSYRSANVMIDCGLDWLGKLKRLDPSAILLTHGHPDHAWGLKRGAPCPVYAPEKTWQELQRYPIKDRHVIKERAPMKICGITFEAFPVEHSILSPAVGYRVSAGRARMFYAPDLIFIHDRKAGLDGAQVYIGDGATLTRSFIRKRGKALIGHSPVPTQLTWCQKEGLPYAIITHCGSEIVTGDEREISAKIRAMAAERHVDVRIAYDGMKVKLRPRITPCRAAATCEARRDMRKGRARSPLRATLGSRRSARTHSTSLRASCDAPYQSLTFSAYFKSCVIFRVEDSGHYSTPCS